MKKLILAVFVVCFSACTYEHTGMRKITIGKWETEKTKISETTEYHKAKNKSLDHK